MDRKITLVTITHTTNEIGAFVQAESTSSVWGRVESVTRQEWNAAGSLGITPSYILKLQSVNYSGQPIVKIDEKRYSVYRTYTNETMDEIELYLEEKAGTK